MSHAIIQRSLQHASLVTLAAALALPATAQDSAGRAVALEEVIVTAQKRQESLQDTPVAVTAFTSESLENLGIVDVSGITGRVPNTILLTTPSSNISMSASVRGVSSNEPSLAQDAKVGLYLDGVYIGKNSGAIFDIADLERIEVLRGPQGTLYGKNTTGGAINIITARPLGEFGFKQKLTLGSFGRTRSQTTLDLPRMGGLAAKLSYLDRSYEGWARNSNPRGPRELGRDDTSGYRLALNWELSDRLTADYSLDRTWGEGTSRPSQLSYANPDYVNLPVVSPTGVILPGAENHPFRQMIESGITDDRKKWFNLDNVGEERYDIRGHSLTLTWSADNFDIKSITGYREMEIRVSPGGTDNDGGAWSVPVFHNATERNGGNQKDHEQWSQEFQVLGSAMDDRLEYIVGLYYYEDEGEEFNSLWDALVPFNGTLLSTRFIPAPAGLGESYSVDNTSYAVFGQATYTPEWLDSRLGITLGLRQTWDEKAASILDTGAEPWTVEKEWDSFNPSLTVDYQWNDDTNVYAKVATGYTAGSHPIRSSSQAAFNLTADPEEIVNYELGIKSDWLDRRLRVNAATFFYDYTDLQIADFQSGSTVVTNAGQADLTGFEFEVTALPLPGLTVDLTYGYLDYDYNEYFVTLDGVSVDVSDTARASNAPRHTARLMVNYDFEPTRFGALSASLESVYTDEYRFNPRQFQHDSADSRNLLNARLNLADIPVAAGSLRAGLWGRNLTDKEYREYGIDFGAIGHAINTYGEPRSFGIDVMYEY
ncbi:TonB-dependent receptor [Haliea atlantica]